MKALDLNFYLFAAAVIAFAWIGFSASRREHSTKDYFHDDKLHKNVVSLAATDVTLGTGLVYLVIGAQHNGLLMLLVPAMVWLGYFLQGCYLERATAVAARTRKNFLAGVNELITKETGNPSPFGRIVSGSLVLVFVLILAFEIFASSKVVAPFLFKEANLSAEAWVSVIVFCITLTYTLLGGIKAVFSVDFIQVPLICLFLPVLLWTSIPAIRDPSQLPIQLAHTLKLDWVALVAVAIACMNAVTTQFYSILNWGAISNVGIHNQKKLLNRVGLISGAVLLLFVLVGLLHPVAPGKQAWQEISANYAVLSSQSGIVACIVSGVLLLGMASILLTTTDAVVINTILFWYDNIAGGDSLSVERNAKELRRIRRIGVAAFTLCFAVLMTINYLQPDPFYLLLSMAGGVVVFAPMIATAGYLCSIQGAARVFTPVVIYAYFGIFALAGVVDVVLLAEKSSLVSYVGLGAFLASVALSLALIAVSRQRA